MSYVQVTLFLEIRIHCVLYIVTEARHAIQRRASDYEEVPPNDTDDEDMLNDYGGAQNDADAGTLFYIAYPLTYHGAET